MAKEMERQSNDAIKTFLNEYGGDGHALIDPKGLVKMGFSEKFVKQFTFVHKSGKSYKETIFDNSGNRIEKIEGVYSLSFAYGIAANIGADTTAAQSKMGRGFQAQELAVAINNVLKA